MRPYFSLAAAALGAMLPLATFHAQSALPQAGCQIRIGQDREAAALLAWTMTPSRSDDKSDPGYALYKEGYALMLEEHYPAARKKFEELLAKYPKSSYADDARYWTAYSLRNSDRERAIEDYRKFIREHPKSPYYDDAVADLNALQIETPAPVVAPVPRPGVPVAITPNTENFMRQMKRNLRLMARAGRINMPGMTFPPGEEEERLDNETRLKMDALYALGENREDDRSFSTLREIALDSRQIRPLREVAMDALSGYTKHDALSVFVEIAKKDTNADIQGFAIDYIGEHGTDKNQRVAVLEDLFRSIPKSRTEQRNTIVYTIADVGNDRAVDFLKKVALSDDDFTLRRDAVYYLGSIGGENARSALYEILKGH
jgi:tetratricopeptide (TPR) repeat protein